VDFVVEKGKRVRNRNTTFLQVRRRGQPGDQNFDKSKFCCVAKSNFLTVDHPACSDKKTELYCLPRIEDYKKATAYVRGIPKVICWPRPSMMVLQLVSPQLE